MLEKVLDIKLGYECNDDCIHCVIKHEKILALKNKSRNRFTTKELKKEILEAKKKKVKKLVLTGGEPTIRTDFVELLNFIKKKKLKTHLQTNGRQLSKKEFYNKIKNNIDSYEIALHGPNSKIHEEITTKIGSFNQTLNGIKNVTFENKNNIIGKIVLSRFNYTKLLETIRLFEKLNVKKVIVAFPHSSGDEFYMKKIAPTYTTIKPFVEKAINYYKNKEYFLLTFENILPCALDEEFNIKFFLDFFENFENVSVKKLGKPPIKWKKTLSEIKKKDKICFECVFNNYCNGYWKEYVDYYGFDEFKPITKIENLDNIMFK